MLNAEKYKKDIEKANYCFAIANNEFINCFKLHTCADCKFDKTLNCGRERFKWLLEEYKEPILTEEDKKILKDVINVFNSFKKEIVDIRKRHICRGCYLYINYVDCGEGVSCIETHTTLPFNGDKLFKGMELNKSYTLEELGL